MTARIRLEREAPAARQSGCATLIGVGLTALGGAALLALQSDALWPASSQWLFYVAGGGFFAVGLVMLILSIKMFLATRLPETIIEVEKMPVRAGKPFAVTVRQPGPIRLKSLRLNLMGEQLTRRRVWRHGRQSFATERLLIHQVNVLDIRDITIMPGEEMVRHGEATVPKEVRLADVEGDTRVVWRLEVWGRVRGWVDFGHPFVIEVLGVAARSAPEGDDQNVPGDDEW